MKPILILATSLIIFASCPSSPDRKLQPGEDKSDKSVLDLSIFDWIDLSYAFDDQTLYWPTSDPFKLDTVFEGETEGGYYYSAYRFSTSEHGGTHLDAPVHFSRGKYSVEKIPLRQLIGSAVIVDVSKQTLANPDYQISVSDFQNWESRYGELSAGIIIVLRTGFGQFWPDANRYLGTDLKGQEGVDNLHFPGLDPEAAQWLVDNRQVKAIGIDTPSIDYGQSKDFGSHQALFAANIPVFENLANLGQLPVGPFILVALPMKIGGGSGAPLRVVAGVQK